MFQAERPKIRGHEETNAFRYLTTILCMKFGSKSMETSYQAHSMRQFLIASVRLTRAWPSWANSGPMKPFSEE